MYKRTKKNNNKLNKRPARQLRSARPFIRTAGDILTKRMTVGSQVLMTSAFGIIPVTTNLQSDQCSQFPSTEWASYSARFGQYRVKSMTLRFRPCFTVNSVATNLLSVMYFSEFSSTSIPTSAAQIIADSKFRMCSTGKEINYTATWARNPNAQLWNPTSAAIPAASRYGVAFCSHTNVNLLPINTIIYTYLMEFEVELKEPN